MKKQSANVNPRVRCDHLVPLELFLGTLTDGHLRSCITTVISDIRQGRVAHGLRALKEVARPEFWSSASDYRVAAQAAALVSKVEFPSVSKRRKEDALSLFLRNERKCRASNKRLAHYFSRWNRMPDNIRVVLSRAKQLVSGVLGQLDEGVLAQIYAGSRFGPGMTLGSQEPSMTTVCYKLTEWPITCSRSAIPYLKELLMDDHHWLSLGLGEGRGTRVQAKLAEAARVTFVPKDALRLRSIAIEPAANGVLQLGVHNYVARRLLREAGMNIRDQRTNQTLARLGSEQATRGDKDPWSTLDLSNASDLISRELVRGLLPSSWFGLLDDLRCQHFSLPGGDTIEAEKFSSMGNGFTFALQTTIFWALAQASSSLVDDEPRAFAYGDDIIVRRSSFALLLEVLKFVGLEVNTSKSFAFGLFRESCGEDWYGGQRVRPTYVRRYHMKVSDCYTLANRFIRLGYQKIGEYYLGLIPEVLRAPIGSCPDDAAYLVSFLEARPWGRWDPALQTWRFKVLRSKPRSYTLDPYVMYAGCLRNHTPPNSLEVSGFKVTRRDRVVWRLGSVASDG